MVNFDQPKIIYEDEAILVIDKPAGLLSLQDGFDHSLPHIQTLLQPVYGPLWMVHRLDRETSGVLVLARSPPSHRELNRQFKERLVEKQYRLLVHGTPAWQNHQVDAPLRKDGDREHRTTIDLGRGKSAQTVFSCLERFSSISLLAAFPHSGYTHQIRVHIASAGFPIVCDQLYQRKYTHMMTEFERHLPIKRVALHAYAISFVHPLSLQPLSFSVPLPDVFLFTLKMLDPWSGPITETADR